MIPKVQAWLNQDYFPQRVLFSGSNGFQHALEAASELNQTPANKLLAGTDSDTMVFQDTGKSFKIDYSESAKKDGQSQWENVRGMIRWISQKPINNHRVLILENLERATLQAPQALLKILEEPPEKAIFLFTTQNHFQILETILSRMTVVVLPPEISSPIISDQLHEYLQATDLLGRFRCIEALDAEVKKSTNKQLFKDFIMALIEQTRKNPNQYHLLPVMLESYQALNRNQNPRLVLERMTLQMMAR